MAESRRKFLNAVLGGSFLGWMGMILYPVFAYLKPPPVADANVNSVKWGPLEEFPVNSGQILKFGRKPVILVRSESGDLRAFAGTCTHLDCIVQYRAAERDIWCACHNGVYDLNGLNVSGPPPRPLDEFAVNVVDGEIVVSQVS
jgi:Rieske Fe-S protein